MEEHQGEQGSQLHTLHVLVHGAVPRELRLRRRQLQVEVVNGDCDDDDQAQDDAQHNWEGLLQPLPLVCDALVSCVGTSTHISVYILQDLHFQCACSIVLSVLFHLAQSFISHYMVSHDTIIFIRVKVYVLRA